MLRGNNERVYPEGWVEVYLLKLISEWIAISNQPATRKIRILIFQAFTHWLFTCDWAFGFSQAVLYSLMGRASTSSCIPIVTALLAVVVEVTIDNYAFLVRQLVHRHQCRLLIVCFTAVRRSEIRRWLLLSVAWKESFFGLFRPTDAYEIDAIFWTRQSCFSHYFDFVESGFRALSDFLFCPVE